MTANEKEFVEKLADFTIKFFRQTQLKTFKSTAISPALINIGFAALSENESDTGRENPNDTKKNFASLWKELQTLKLSRFHSKVIYRIYIRNGLKLDRKFTENLEKYFGEDIIHELESNNYEEERNKINKSIEVLTNKIMPEIIPPESIDNSTQIFLINVVRFFGEWKHQFSPDFSIQQKFYVTKDIVRYVSFIRALQRQYLYENTDDYEVVGLEYVENFIMFIILPKQQFGLSKIIESLNGSDLIKLSKNKSTKLAEIILPRFTCNTNLDAVEVYKNNGFKSSISADFLALLNYDSNSRLFYQHLFHQTFIQLNHKSDEKDFAFCRSPSTGPGCPKPPSEILLTADHPFLYFISDKNSNIMFIGSVVDDFQPDVGKVFYEGPKLFKFLSTPQEDEDGKFNPEIIIPAIKFELHQNGHFFINPFLKSTIGFEKYVTNEWILVQMKKLIYKTVNRVILKEETKIANPYSGLGGIVYALLKAQKYFDKNFSDEILQICGEYMNTQKFVGDRIATYYMYLEGNFGLNIVNAILHFIKNKETSDMSKIIKKVVAKKYSQNQTINNGRCGLLAGILTLKLEANQKIQLDDNEIHEVLTKIINVGHENSMEHSMKVPLRYFENNNLGFLNGLYGILQMLLSFWVYLDDIQKEYVKDTVDWLINGNDETTPPPAKKQKEEKEDSREGRNEIYGKCQLFIVSYLVFGEKKYLNAANACCDEIWEQGISSKNIGLDNGISGNGYAFLLMYRLTKDEKFLVKAKIFALILLDSEFEKQISEFVKNPFSLFQGWTSVLCFLTDFIDPQNAQFPFIPILFNKEL